MLQPPENQQSNETAVIPKHDTAAIVSRKLFKDFVYEGKFFFSLQAIKTFSYIWKKITKSGEGNPKINSKIVLFCDY